MKHDFAVAHPLLVLLLLVGLVWPTWAQSGRKPQPSPTPRVQTQQPTTPGKPTSQPAADKPLVVTAPTVVDEDGTLRVDTSLVTIPVSVLDREGRFVPTLLKRDFQVFEDGIEQEIENLSPVEVPFHVVLLLDTSGSTRLQLPQIQDAALGFVRQLRADDRVMVVSFDSETRVECEFTSDRNELRRAIFQTRPGGATKLYEAVHLVLTEALSKIKGRKAVVLFSDGADSSSRFASARSTLDLVEESDALVFPIYYDTSMDNPSGPVINGRRPPIGFPMPGPSRRRWPLVNYQWPQRPPGRLPMPGQADNSRAKGYLQDLAQHSGGRLYEADSPGRLSDAFASIAEELRHQYAISYYPTNPQRDGSFRRVKVLVGQSSLVVRARDGYRAVDPTKPDNDEDGKENRKRPTLKRRQLAE